MGWVSLDHILCDPEVWGIGSLLGVRFIEPDVGASPRACPKGCGGVNQGGHGGPPLRGSLNPLLTMKCDQETAGVGVSPDDFSSHVYLT